MAERNSRFRKSIGAWKRQAVVEPDWSQLSAEDLSLFAKREASPQSGFGRKAPGVALRAFLRFLVAQGLVRDGLAAAIPSPRHYQHAALPDRSTAEQVAAVLKCCQDDTPVGRRDYSVLLLFSPTLVPIQRVLGHRHPQG